MSILSVDLRDAEKNGLTAKPIRNMVNHETNELFFENLEIPCENLIGAEGQGFKYILDGLNAERALISAECIGGGYWFLDRVTRHVQEREVFGRPIEQNQGVQFPIADADIEIEAANLMRYEACRLFDERRLCGAQANMAKFLAAKAAGRLPMLQSSSTVASDSHASTTWSANSARRASTRWLRFRPT